jgi:hypothetical protein
MDNPVPAMSKFVVTTPFAILPMIGGYAPLIAALALSASPARI